MQTAALVSPSKQDAKVSDGEKLMERRWEEGRPLVEDFFGPSLSLSLAGWPSNLGWDPRGRKFKNFRPPLLFLKGDGLFFVEPQIGT